MICELLVTNETLYSIFDHFATSVMFSVTDVLKSYILSFKYQPKKLLPFLVGSAGLFVLSLYNIVWFSTIVPPSVSNETIYLFLSHFATSMIFDCYYQINCKQWLEDKNADFKLGLEKCFKTY